MLIHTILDNDLYKFTMQQAVLELFPNVEATYVFKNRRATAFTDSQVATIRKAIEDMGNLSLTPQEAAYLRKLPFMKPGYVSYLQNFRYNPIHVTVNVTPEKDLDIVIKGPWVETILWEVPIMAIVSEAYFEGQPYNEVDFRWNTAGKVHMLNENGCPFSEFGTRRRRSYAMQDTFLDTLRVLKKAGNLLQNFMGTSNVHLAMKYDLKPIGTMAHEWIMAHSALCSLKHANRYALENWVKVYKGQLGIALTDTFGTDAFFQDFYLLTAKIYDGVRHDSGDPLVFADKIIAHYKMLGINPLHKMIVFSDGLDAKEAVKIKNHCHGKIGYSFGIGTNFTNDVPDSKPLNMVIKLRTVDDQEVVKISDAPGKATGDAVALDIAYKTFGIQNA